MNQISNSEINAIISSSDSEAKLNLVSQPDILFSAEQVDILLNDPDYETLRFTLLNPHIKITRQQYDEGINNNSGKRLDMFISRYEFTPTPSQVDFIVINSLTPMTSLYLLKDPSIAFTPEQRRNIFNSPHVSLIRKIKLVHDNVFIPTEGDFYEVINPDNPDGFRQWPTLLSENLLI